VDAEGNVLIADRADNRIRLLAADTSSNQIREITG
jgi:hypothetical protein